MFALTKEKQELTEHLDRTIHERDEVANALRRAMVTTRELASRLKIEQIEKKRLSNELQSLIDAKASISSAILDALHQERLKNMQLAATLATHPYELAIIAKTGQPAPSAANEDVKLRGADKVTNESQLPQKQSITEEHEHAPLQSPAYPPPSFALPLTENLSSMKDNALADKIEDLFSNPVPNREKRGVFDWMYDDTHISKVLQPTLYPSSEAKSETAKNTTNNNKNSIPFVATFRETVVDELKK